MEDRVRQFESDIQTLKTRYDQYFLGVLKRPPEKLAGDVAREVRRFSTVTINNTALRFRVQQAVSRYNIFLQYWQRNLRDIEEGKTPRRRRVVNDGEPLQSGVIEISSPEEDREQMNSLFMVLDRTYRKNTGRPGPTIASVRKMVSNQTRMIREKYSCDRVAYRVEYKDGKVRIKAAPVGMKR